MFRFRHQLKYMLNYRYPSTKPKVPPVSYIERQKMQAEIDRQTNINVLKRELFNDTMQLPIKFMAYYMTNQQTYFAELIRSMIDASNHLILFATNYINYGPNKQFPYGIEKVKHMVALIPSALFFYFGSTITYESILNLYNIHSFEGEIHGNTWGLVLYLLSIGIESTIVLKNVRDAQRVDQTDNQKKSIIATIKDLFSKKDPLLQAILYENAITMISTLVPLLSSLGSLIYPTHVFEIGGSLIIGIIQLNLAYHLAFQNISSLMGEQSIGEKEVLQILDIIKKNENVLLIQNEKAVMVGSRNFRFTAEITFNIERINQQTQQKYQERFLKIIYSDSYKDREDYLSELLQEVQEDVFAKLHVEIQNIEQEIREAFPNCIHLDFEINQKQLAETYTLDEGNSLFGDALENPSLVFEKWMLEEADRLIKKFAKKRDSTYFESYHTYCQSIDYSQWKQFDENDEDIKYQEEFRFEELTEELNNQSR